MSRSARGRRARVSLVRFALLVAAGLVVALLVLRLSGAGGQSLTAAEFVDGNGGISLTYAASWALTREDHPGHYESVLGFLGTGLAHQECPSDYIPGAGGCTDVYDLGPNTFVLRIAGVGGPPVRVSQVDDLLTFHPAATPTTIAGQPAAVEVVAPGPGDLSITWTLTRPGEPWAAYRLTASFRGPDIETARRAVEGVVDSIAYVGAP
jgi:hypothetical protein